MPKRLPPELIHEIITYISSDDLSSLACVCCDFRRPAQLALFRKLEIWFESLPNTSGHSLPYHTDFIRFYEYILGLVSHLVVCNPPDPTNVRLTRTHDPLEIHHLWRLIPTLDHLLKLSLIGDPGTHAALVSALDSRRTEIELEFMDTLSHQLPVSNSPLPIWSLFITVDGTGAQAAQHILKRASKSLRKLELGLKGINFLTIPNLPVLCNLSLVYDLPSSLHDPTQWLQFLDQHKTITQLRLHGFSGFPVPPSLDLLPNLQNITANLRIIEDLVPGRPVNFAKIIYPRSNSLFGILPQSLAQSSVRLTSLFIDGYKYFPVVRLADLVLTLPALQKIISRHHWLEVC